MKKENIKIGSHVDFKAPKYLLGALEMADKYNSTATSFYTGAPQNKLRAPIENLKIKEGRKYLEDSKIDINSIVIHAPYIINLATYKDDLWKYSIDFIISELKRTSAIGSSQLVLHPGNYTNTNKNVGIERLSKALNIIFEKTANLNTKISIETMAGKGTEIGKNFEEIKEIIALVKNKKRISVCMDICHTWDSGYNWEEGIDKVIDEFDSVVGLKYLSVIHLNNSKNTLGSRKDRHDNILTGKINPKVFKEIVWSERLKDIPKILETPYVDGEPIYKDEIDFLLN